MALIHNIDTFRILLTLNPLKNRMKKLSFVVSLPGDNNYLREQEAAAKTMAQRLGLELRVINAKSDPVAQSQQLLEIVQSRSAPLPDAIMVEPVTNAGLPRVAEAAVAAGIGWVISNARVDYLEALRKTAKAPVFCVSQDHVEIGRMQGRQFGALLPRGGSVLYLRGPASNFLAAQRAEGMESATPPNIKVKTLKIQWTSESAYESVSSWVRLPTVRAVGTQLISAQNTDFVLAAKKVFQDHSDGPERTQWLGLPYTGAGVASQIKPLVNNGALAAAVITSLTADTAMEMMVKALQNGSQPQETTFVPSSSYPNLEQLAAKHG
jgi:ribose transport system substrate-binding protein